ncbi:LLM class flavin-dependent oxidoreductase [Caballeronia sp. LZ035]|uniref:LLM class flavin-dependent oxidoreductase n=1 Tax=Caballeronia sp. LZ035 TaxID=3038568 RepID=UPI00286733A5|nr:LLM class flavin-dependent oxidoreductase [Caballeronia sp. LZ035]MDR5760622.1 LLM class flavin-dependent oxidoreductase [Caballeronia sp. LZ035]
MSTSLSRQIKLAAYVMAGPVSGHHGGWRYPSAQHDILNVRFYQDLGRQLEAGKFDMMFMPDIQALPRRLGDSLDSQLKHGALGALRLDPLLVLTAIAGSTSRLGLAATISTSYFSPFQVARSLATMDHLSAGRAAWNIVTSFQDAEARNYGLKEQLSRDERYARAEEFVDVTCKLWNSWHDDALKWDRAAPQFADPSRVAPIDHHGKWFDVAGPLNVSRPPQGRPVFIQAGASDRGRDFAAKWAEVIFVTHSSIESAQAFYADIKERARKFGRDPDQVNVLLGMVPVVGETDAIARDTQALLDSLCEPEAGLSTLSYQLDVDLSPFPQDEVLPDLDVAGVQGHYREVAELTRKQNLSLRDIGKRYGIGPLRDFNGSGSTVAARMQEWFDARACDGFMVQMPYLPGGVEDFVRLVVPELQTRRVFREDYAGTTLREHLGLDRPAH